METASLLRFSRQMKRPWRSWLLAFALFALVPIACGKVEGSPDLFDCDQPIASYCAAQAGGCPASDAPADLCAWLARRGGNSTASSGGPLGFPLTCEEMPERKYFSVVDGHGHIRLTYVFVRGSLSYVFDASGPMFVALPARNTGPSTAALSSTSSTSCRAGPTWPTEALNERSESTPPSTAKRRLRHERHRRRRSRRSNIFTSRASRAHAVQRHMSPSPCSSQNATSRGTRHRDEVPWKAGRALCLRIA